jgi:hypothetical protein
VIELVKKGYVSIIADPAISCPPENTFDIHEFHEAIAWDGSNRRAFLYSGIVQWMKGDCGGALKYWREAANAPPVSKLTWLHIGKGELVSGDIESAVTAFRSAKAGPLLINLANHADSIEAS